MLPTASATHLQRRRDRLFRRRQALEGAIAEVDTALAEVAEAELVLFSPQNGTRAKLPKILKGLKITRKDMVLAILRTRPSRGATRVEIAEMLKARRGVALSLDSVTVYLSQLKADGLVRNDAGRWYAAP